MANSKVRFFFCATIYQPKIVDAAAATKAALSLTLDNYLSQKPSIAAQKELTRDDVANLISSFYMDLLEKSSRMEAFAFPETLKLDEARIKAIGEKYFQLVIATSSIFIACNLAGKNVCESANFKMNLKNDLIVITNDIDYE